MVSEIEQSQSAVSIHIRRGDYVSDADANNLMGILPMGYYDRAVNYINERVKNPSYYIFSDDLEWTKDHLKVDAPLTFVDLENGSRDYIELDIMRKCRHNIIANSSFSWWAAFLNQHPDKIVVAPARWVMPDETNRRIAIQFPSWIKL